MKSPRMTNPTVATNPNPSVMKDPSQMVRFRIFMSEGSDSLTHMVSFNDIVRRWKMKILLDCHLVIICNSKTLWELPWQHKCREEWEQSMPVNIHLFAYDNQRKESLWCFCLYLIELLIIKHAQYTFITMMGFLVEILHCNWKRAVNPISLAYNVSWKFNQYQKR